MIKKATPRKTLPSLLSPGIYEGPLYLDLSATDGSGFFSARRFKRKVWFYSGVFHKDLFLGSAIVDAGYFATAFAYAFDPATDSFTEISTVAPFYFPSSFSPGPYPSFLLEKSGMKFSIEGRPGSESDRPQYSINVESKKLSIQYEIEEESAGLSALCNAKGRPFNYTYKNTALPVKAEVSIPAATGKQGQKTALQKKITGYYGGIDFSQGYPPRRTYWNWFCISGQGADGSRIGINLVGEHNNGLENGLWFDNKLYNVSQAVFDYDSPESIWKLHTTDGIIEATFQPLGSRSENLNLGVLISRFTQPFGTVEGTIRLPGKKEPVPFQGAGVVEEHDAKW